MAQGTYSSKEGFSLVELIITIGIVAVVTGALALSFGLLRSADSQGIAQRIDSGLDTLKTRNMADGQTTYMNIYLYDNNYYIRYTKGTEPLKTIDTGDLGKKIGSGNVNVTFNGVTVVENQIYSFTIKKYDGSFGSKYYVTPNGDTVNDCSKTLPSSVEFTVKAKSGGALHKVVLVSGTGRHYTEG